MQYFLKLKQEQRRRGFTLIETLVATFILLLAIVGPMTIYWRFIRDTNDLRTNLVAQYLAQEGIELMMNAIYRNLDANVSDSHDGLAGLVNLSACQDNDLSPTITTRKCGMNYNDLNVVANCLAQIANSPCRLFQRNSSPAFYRHSGGVFTIPTQFYRKLSYEIVQTADKSGVLQIKHLDPTQVDLRDFEEVRIRSEVSTFERGVWRTRTVLHSSIFNDL